MDHIQVKDIAKVMELLAPPKLAEDYDNVGLLIGSYDKAVKNVLVGLELTDAMLEEAIKIDCHMIIVHHPLIFKPIMSIVDNEPISNRIMQLIKHDISLYVSHTNLDKTIGGLNDYVARRLDIQVTNIINGELIPNIRIGNIEKQRLIDFIKTIKVTLDLEYINFCGDNNKLISKVGICTGSGMNFYGEAIKAGVDVFITGDMKYHDAVYANDMRTPIIDVTHFGSEVIVSELFYDTLKRVFKDKINIHMTKAYKSPIKTI